jgi:DNA-binding transcriptional LysR family regulator
MDLRTLNAFVEVVRQGGFSAAAKTLFTTQPSVSKAVRQLEDELGVPLLDRVGHRIRPTAAGDLVLRRATAMLAERANLQDDLAELNGLKRGRLRLGLSRLGSSILFARLVAEFQARHPGIDIELVEHGSLFLEQALREGALDLAMCMLPVHDDLEWERVHDDPLMALLPEGHPLAGHPSVTLGQLSETPFILFEQGFALNPQILAACQRSGFSPRVAAYSGQADFIQAMVAAGMGVAFLPRLICHGIRAPVTCSLLDDDQLRWRITLAWKRDARLSPAACSYLELTRSALIAGSLEPGLTSPGSGRRSPARSGPTGWRS